MSKPNPSLIYKYAFSIAAKLTPRNNWIFRLVKKFSALYGNRTFIAVFVKCHHWPLPRVQSIETPRSHFMCLRSVWMVYSSVCLGLQSCPFLQVIPTNPCLIHHLLHARFIPHLSYSDLVDDASDKQRIHIMKLLITQLSPVLLF
jgi:hypothetical protein